MTQAERDQYYLEYLTDQIVEFRLESMFGDGQDEQMVREGATIKGTDDMTLEELQQEFGEYGGCIKCLDIHPEAFTLGQTSDDKCEPEETWDWLKTYEYAVDVFLVSKSQTMKVEARTPEEAGEKAMTFSGVWHHFDTTYEVQDPKSGVTLKRTHRKPADRVRNG